MGKRYQVRGPFGDQRSVNNARWTVVDTFNRDEAVDFHRTKRDATDVAKELNEEKKDENR